MKTRVFTILYIFDVSIINDDNMLKMINLSCLLQISEILDLLGLAEDGFKLALIDNEA